MKQGQFPVVLNLTDLNGQNGFKLDGENNGDVSGVSVSAAGDINGDGHDDLIIGADWYPGGSKKGRSYVLFGGSGIGSSGQISLSGLNGVNGFKIDGENNEDWSGYPVSMAGDINGDGYADLIIGALGYPASEYNGKGRSYVVFGGPNVGSSGVIALSSLNGANGFKLDGENSGDQCGQSVSVAGDINGDGHADLIIGAFQYGNNKGRSYVVFGRPGVGKDGVIAVSSLNGSNGFRLDGENNGDRSGFLVSGVGDINDDGYDDLIIGADGYLGGSNKGRSYVVFGGSEVGSSGIIPLSILNGSNGFKLNGENNSQSGWWVSRAGDVNGDGHNDLLIGAIAYPGGSGKGCIYLVFGGPGVGSSGLFSLSSLNGANGFRLDGEFNNDYSSHSINTAGDINGDGYDDLIIGAHGYPEGSFKGRSYVVFGGSGVGGDGMLSLSSLNGINGFKLDGENNNDASGRAVNIAGDINGDGCTDLIIAAVTYPAGSSKGRSYVVFGDVPPVLVNNNLVLLSGEAVSLSAFDLAAYDRNHDNSTLVFIPTNIIHGQFESINNPDVALNNFTQQQIWDDQILFIHDGSSDAPTYNITVRSDGIAWTGPISANITFNSNKFLILENNQLFINQGQTVVLTSNNLKATYLDNAEGDLSFLISDLAHGQFEFLSAPNQSILTFQQQNISDGVVQFIHDNSPSAPSYQVAVSNGTLTTSPQPALIDFDPLPLLIHNSLAIAPGQTLTLTSSHLYAIHNGIVDPNLIFIITDVQNGFFTVPNNQKSETTSQGNITFLQQQVMDKAVLFSQQGPGLSLPTYSVVVSDGRITTSPAPAAITLKQGQFPAVIQLADLNGQNGFKLDGENNGDRSGISVSAAGDINGDGYDDLIIGADQYPDGGRKGRSYVVFGGPGIGSSGKLSLSSLHVPNGFKLDGENNNDWSGYPVSMVEDINGDGYVDLMIGASGYLGGNYKGRSYVVFGGPEVGSSGSITLSSLNGANGFKLDGENNNDASSTSASTAGDINGDGYVDLIIGAVHYPGNSDKGRSYVVFGGPGVGSGGVFGFSTLNGSNGFKLDGENNGDDSGRSVSVVGDINGDGYDDLIIGASQYGGLKGRSYVLFGGLGVGSSGLFSLSSLNGVNGFKLDGENNNDRSGFSVNAAGDVNGDKYADLIIGAFGYPGSKNKGRSYVVFGGFGVGSGGVFNLSSLNGTNGFKLDGENNGDRSGISVSAAGDINGDGIADLLIGAEGYPNATYKGRSYVVFGGPGVGSSGDILLSSLNGANGFKLDGEYNNDDSGWYVAAAEDINSDGCADLIIGANGYPGGNAQGRSYVVFGDAPPVLVNNSLSLSPGAKIALQSSHLGAYDRNHNNNTLVFVPSNISHGYFSTLSAPTTPLVNFTQSQVINSTIQFVHDGSLVAPNYNISVYSTGIAWTGPLAANITFSPTNSTTTSDQTASIAGGVAGAVVGLAVITGLGIGLCRRKKPEEDKDLVQNPLIQSSSPFDVQLASITQGDDFPKDTISNKTSSTNQENKDEKQPLIHSLPQQDEEDDFKKISFEISYEVSYADLEIDKAHKLGEGISGTVYRGVYKYNPVAIKELHTQNLSKVAQNELIQEAKIMAEMHSDYLVQLRGICMEAPHFCLVMELMPKGSLYDVLRTNPDWSLSVKYRIALDVVSGLAQLHEKNIIHRDLKSLNILLSDTFRAKISDFGLAKVKSEITSTSQSKGMVGTLGWAAPEVLDQKPHTKSTDIYAFTMVLWEMMVSPYRIPFQGMTATPLIAAKINRGDRQEMIPGTCPPELSNIIRSGWKKSNERPTAQALVKSLSALFSASQHPLTLPPGGLLQSSLWTVAPSS